MDVDRTSSNVSNGLWRRLVTEVPKRLTLRSLFCLLLLGVLPAAAQNNAAAPTSASPTASGSALYQRLQTAGLDPQRVYHVREASLDREDIHISLDDGTVAFTEDIFGRPTGAFFEGHGEILLVPQDHSERLSMGLFTGAAILEEKFSTAYFRFNDDTFRGLEPTLRPATDPQAFIAKWGEPARNLAEADALRLLLTFSRYLPEKTNGAPSEKFPFEDRLLHARIQGEHLGNFDVFFDTTATEQISVGQLTFKDGVGYYDLWASFPMHSARDLKIAARLKTLQEEATISNYRIRAQVTPPRELAAEAVLNMEMKVGGERTLLFELSRYLDLKEMQADGEPVEFIHNPALEGTQLARRGNDLVAVVFPHALRAGEKLTLRFVYHGAVLSEAGSGLLYVGARGTWYPNRGVEMSNFDLQFSYPSEWTLLATGKRASPDTSTPSPPGEQVGRWTSERPIPLAGFNLGQYVRATARAGNIEVDTYAASGVERAFPRPRPAPEPPPARRRSLEQPLAPMPPVSPNPARSAQSVADKSAHAIEFISHLFGPFPYSSLALTQMPGFESQGWPGLVFLSSLAFLTPEERTRLHLDPFNSILSDELMVNHETAHQWWGDLVMFKTYRDQWVMEALANYSALMLIEQEDPAKFSTVLEQYRQMLEKKNKDGDPTKDAGAVTLGQRLSCSKFPDGYDVISYGRGTWLFHMLRHMFIDAEEASRGPRRGSTQVVSGNQLFLKALKNLLARYAGHTLTTSDVQQELEKELPRPLWYEGKKSLDWFFEDWVNGTAIPRLELANAKITRRNGSNVASGTIQQKDAPDDLTTSVPIYAVVGSASPVLLGRVFADGPETPFRLPAPTGARKLLIDPYQTVLTKPR